MPASVAQIAANRANAQKSTGPKTDKGKIRSSQNGLTHGVTAQQHIATGEELHELAALRNSLIDSYQPTDQLELMLVDRIVIATWKLRRLANAEATYYHLEHRSERDRIDYGLLRELKLEPERPVRNATGRVLRYEKAPLPPELLTALMLRDDDCPLQRYQIYEQRLESAIYRAMRQLRQLRKDRGEPEPAENSGQSEANLPELARRDSERSQQSNVQESFGQNEPNLTPAGSLSSSNDDGADDGLANDREVPDSGQANSSTGLGSVMKHAPIVATLILLLSLSVAFAQESAQSSNAPATQPATSQPSSNGQASQQYFNQVCEILDHALTMRTAKVEPSFYSNSANKITTLPKENVDADVVAWGSTAALALTNAANTMDAGKEKAESRANSVASPGAKDANDPNRQEEARVDVQNVQQARRQGGVEERAAAGDRIQQLLANLQESRTKVAEQLTQRYGGVKQ